MQVRKTSLEDPASLKIAVDYSFIIPIKDHRELTRDMLLSLLTYTGATIAHAEVILVDDASGPETAAWLNSLEAPFRVIRNPENLGFAASNNRAAEDAKGETLVLLNNDLLLTPHWIAPMIRIFGREKGIGLLGNVQLDTRSCKVDHFGKFFDDAGLPHHFGQHLGELFPIRPEVDFFECPVVTAACWMIRKEVFLGLGGFDEDYRNGYEDDDFCVKLSRNGLRIGIAPESVIWHHVSRSAGRKDHEDLNRERFRTLWSEWGRGWNREHFAATLNLLKSWHSAPEQLPAGEDPCP